MLKILSMKKKEKPPPSASRVAKAFANKNRVSSSKNRAHKYKKEKAPPVPSGLDQLSFAPVGKLKTKPMGQAEIIPQKISFSALEQLHCSACQNYPLSFLEKWEALQKRSIKNCPFKEQLIATRNLKKLSLEMQQWIYSQVEGGRVKAFEDSSMELEQLIEKREERHFRIDRILQYLTDL